MKLKAASPLAAHRHQMSHQWPLLSGCAQHTLLRCDVTYLALRHTVCSQTLPLLLQAQGMSAWAHQQFVSCLRVLYTAAHSQ